jgi:EVE domain-containing protein
VPKDATISADLAALLSAYDDYLTVAETTSDVWIFQVSPQFYNIRGAIRALKEQTWLVSAYKNRIRSGHRVYVWESGPDAGILATAHVLTDPAEITDRDEEQQFVRDAKKFDGLQRRVVLRIDRVLEHPLLRKILLLDPVLSKMQVITQPRGTNFVVTPEQAERIDQLLSEPDKPTDTDVRENSLMPKEHDSLRSAGHRKDV